MYISYKQVQTKNGADAMLFMEQGETQNQNKNSKQGYKKFSFSWNGIYLSFL